LMTDERVSWIKKGKLVADSAAVVFSKADGDVKGSFTPLVSLTRKVNGKEQRIIVSGNADFLSNQGINRPMDRNQANKELGISLFSWFANGQFPVDTRHPPMKDNRLNLTSPGLKTMKIIYMGVFPGLLLIGGAVFLIRRKRK
jgi:ABC-2 type transport system permease protein